MPQSKSIVGVSDVSVGFGSPEIVAMMDSLSKHYGRESLVIEPDEISRPPLRRPPTPRVSVERVPSPWQTYSRPYRVEYVNRAAERVNRLRPDLLIIFCTFCIPVLFKLRYRPKFVIYHSYEIVTKYGAHDIAMNRQANRWIDLVTFPEENRARIDTATCGYTGTNKAILYNCGDLLADEPATIIPSDERNGRIIYYGTISRRASLADYFLEPKIQGIPLDLYGRVMEPTEQETRDLVGRFSGSVRYHGLLEAEDLVRRRGEYAYSVVMWNPAISDNHLYAAPNRLFSSIQAGVPPIVAPHPQCRIIVDRYDCGLVMRDWSFEAFYDALRLAMKLYGTSRYAELVENCRLAGATELNWNAQFNKIRRFLPAELS